MAATVRVKMNGKGVRDLLRSPQVAAMLRRRGQKIAEAAGPGHQVDLNIESRRASVIVFTATFDAILAEARNRNLTRALDAGRR